jgi:hypothetical protein
MNLRRESLGIMTNLSMAGGAMTNIFSVDRLE